MKKALSLVLALLLVVMAFTACGGDETPAHTHTFATSWSTDATNHWHAATCEHTTEKSDLGAHVDADGNDVCDVCSYVNDHTHTYDTTTWKSDETGHYHAATCGHDLKADLTDHVDTADNNGICDVCAYVMCKHTYESGWTSAGEAGHWHAPTCGHTVDGTDLTAHADENAIPDGICDTCQAFMYHVHTWDETTWKSDATGHWHGATCEGHADEKKDFAAHVDADKNGKCDVCEYVVCAHTYATEYSTDDNYHWFAVTCGCNVLPKDKAAHVDNLPEGNPDKICDVCNVQVDHIHTWDTSKWSSDANSHWHACTCDPADPECKADPTTLKNNESEHTADDKTGLCTVCNYVVFRFFTAKIEGPAFITPGDSVTRKEGTENIDLTFSAPITVIVDGVSVGQILNENTKDNIVTYLVRIPKLTSDVTVTVSAHTLTNVELIESDGKLNLTAEDYNKLEGTITVDLEEGHYVIYSPSNSFMKFSLDGVELEKKDYATSYEFNVTEAGEISIGYSFWPNATGAVSETYVIAKFSPTNSLSELEGSGSMMPTNATVSMNFTVPEAGLWQMTSSSDIYINDNAEKPYIFLVEEGKLDCTALIYYAFTDEAVFEFDWKIEKVGGTPIDITNETTEGLVAPVGEYFTSVAFTPDKNGSYNLLMSSEDMILSAWVEYEATEYSDAYSEFARLGSNYDTPNMVAGETYIFYLRADPYRDLTEDVTGSLTFEYLGYSPEMEENKSVWTGMAAVDAMNIFSNNYSNSEYTITATNGLVSLDNQTFEESVTVTPEDYGKIFYYVQSNSQGTSEVAVTITRNYQVYWTPGSYTLTMKPNQPYNVYLSGSVSGMYGDYELAWSATGVSVEYGYGDPITLSPIAIEDMEPWNSLVITYTGDTAADIDFILTDTGTDPILNS